MSAMFVLCRAECDIDHKLVQAMHSEKDLDE